MVRRLILAGVIWALVGSLAFLSSPALATDKVTLRLDWVYGSEHAPIFLARDKGFFAQEGIDVQFLPGQGSTVTVKLVGNGTADFGYATADQALMAYAKDLPVIALAVILQKNASAIIYPTATGIKTLKDLYGKTLGVPMQSVGEKQWRAIIKINGLDGSKIKEVPTDRNIAAMIEAKKVDAAIAYFFNDGLKLITDGIPTKWILFADVGVPWYSTALLTNADKIKKNPGLVRRFTRAFVRGWDYALGHEKEALDAFLKDNPQADVKYSTVKLPEVLRLTQTDDTIKHSIGYSTKEKWEAMQKSLLDLGLMQTHVDVTKVFTNEFLSR